MEHRFWILLAPKGVKVVILAPPPSHSFPPRGLRSQDSDGWARLPPDGDPGVFLFV